MRSTLSASHWRVRGAGADARARSTGSSPPIPATRWRSRTSGRLRSAKAGWTKRAKHFAAALAADADSTQANNGLGVVELKAGNRAAAIEHFARAVRRDPENYDALYNLATELVNDGRSRLRRDPTSSNSSGPRRRRSTRATFSGPGAAAPVSDSSRGNVGDGSGKRPQLLRSRQSIRLQSAGVSHDWFQARRRSPGSSRDVGRLQARRRVSARARRPSRSPRRRRTRGRPAGEAAADLQGRRRTRPPRRPHPRRQGSPDQGLEAGGSDRSPRAASGARWCLFQHVAEPEGTYLEMARRTIGAEVSTNQGAPRGHLYLIVFDQNHITPGNEVRARQSVERFLRTRVKPGDRVGLYALPGPGPQLPLSSNPNLALDELPKVRGMLECEGMAVGATMTDFEAYQIVRGDTIPAALPRPRRVEPVGRAATSSASGHRAVSATDTANETVEMAKENARTIVERVDSETRAFLLTFADIVRELAQIEGRKTVILVSEGFFTDHLRADIDNGPRPPRRKRTRSSTRSTSTGATWTSTRPHRSAPRAAAEVQSRLDSLHDARARNVGRRGARRRQPHGRGAQPDRQRFDGLLHRGLRAAAERALGPPGLPPGESVGDAAGRAGGVAHRLLASATRDAGRSAAVAIDAALGAPFPQQGLPLEMTTYVTEGNEPRRAAGAAEPSGRSARRHRHQHEAGRRRVRRQGRARRPRGRASGTDIMPLPKTAAPGRTTAQGQFRVQFDLPAGEYLLRAAVREPGGTTGTVDRRFEVRALDGVDVTASDLIIGRRSDALPVRPTCYVSEGLSAALEVYARNPVDLESVDVTLDIVPINGDAGRPVCEGRPDGHPPRRQRRWPAGAGRRPARRRAARRLHRAGDRALARRDCHRGHAAVRGVGRGSACHPGPRVERVTPR